jgi:hypothetical protein
MFSLKHGVKKPFGRLRDRCKYNNKIGKKIKCEVMDWIQLYVT